MNIDKLKQVIRKANLEISLNRPLRLADVLLARKMSIAWYEDNKGEGYYMLDDNSIEILRNWNLKDNDLDHQSDPTKKFLIELLVPKK